MRVVMLSFEIKSPQLMGYAKILKSYGRIDTTCM